MLRLHRMLILNYCCAKKQVSSGVVECLENKARDYAKSPRFAPFIGLLLRPGKLNAYVTLRLHNTTRNQEMISAGKYRYVSMHDPRLFCLRESYQDTCRRLRILLAHAMRLIASVLVGLVAFCADV
jgi:hypothetical protein